MNVEIPLAQTEIYNAYNRDQVMVFGVNHESSHDLIQDYVIQRQITIPILMDAEDIFTDFYTHTDFGFEAPNYILIDQIGRIHARYDGVYGKIPELTTFISDLLQPDG